MKRLAPVFILILLGACSSQPVEPNYYLLRSDSDLSTRALQPAEDFALGKVTIAPSIDQRGLLLETAEGDVRPARHHLWAEPLYEGVSLFLLKEISAASGSDLLPAPVGGQNGTINIRIDQLHGTNDGRALLVAYWWLEQGGKLITAYQFAEHRAIERDGYAALADAERGLLAALAVDIAEAIKASRSAAE